MNPGIPLALLQLRREKKRVAAAVTGIFFAVLLMLVQLGFQDALLASAGLHINAFNCDVILASPHYQYLIQPDSIPERRIYQAAADPRVARITPLYIGSAPWKNPLTRQERVIVMLGVPPINGIFARPDIEARIDALKDSDAALFDAKGRTEFGPVPEMFRKGQLVAAEILHRRVAIAGLFEIGTTFGIDGTVIMSDLAFRRILTGGASATPSLGLIRLVPGANADQVRAALAATLPDDVRVYTRAEFVRHEQHYWSTNTPIGFLFKLGVGMGLIVGLIVVYQILYTDVMEHLGEYATLKAIGYTNGYLFGIVLQQGLLLSIAGFLPGVLASIVVYRVTAEATFLPLAMTWERAAIVYGLTWGMCMIAAALAMRPVRTIDPAEICTR
jgi:putative ABC transport system permease protein